MEKALEPLDYWFYRAFCKGKTVNLSFAKFHWIAICKRAFLTVWRFFDANNAMTNATGKNGVNHGINHGVKETPSRE